MTKRKARGAKTSNPGTDAANAASSYWHRMACRVFLHLQNTNAHLKGDARYEEIALFLNRLGVRARGGGRLNVENVKAAIEDKKRLGIFQAIEACYKDALSDLLDFDKEREYAAAIEKDRDGHSWKPDIASAAAALDRLRPYCPLPRAYDILAARTSIRLKAVLDQAQLEWSSLQQENAKYGGDSCEFPATSIIARAFPTLPK